MSSDRQPTVLALIVVHVGVRTSAVIPSNRELRLLLLYIKNVIYGLEHVVQPLIVICTFKHLKIQPNLARCPMKQVVFCAAVPMNVTSQFPPKSFNMLCMCSCLSVKCGFEKIVLIFKSICIFQLLLLINLQNES